MNDLPAHRLTPAHRLRKPAEYKSVFAKATRSSDRYWTVLAHRGKAGRPRLGLAIAKRVVRRAVARNRLKRVVRESFRQTAHRLAPVDFVVMAKHQALAAEPAKLNASLCKHWQRLSREFGADSAKTGDPRSD